LVDEISVILENKPGELAKITHELAINGVDIQGLSVSVSNTQSVLRLLCSNHNQAFGVLEKLDYPVTRHEVILLEVENSPGILAKVAGKLAGGGVNIEYLYAAMPRKTGKPLLVFRVDRVDAAKDILAKIDEDFALMT
jgi:hypothetical protein